MAEEQTVIESTTIESTIVGLDLNNWQQTVVFLLTIINYVVGETGHAKLHKPLCGEDLLKLADQLMVGSYQPQEWFQADSRLADKNFLKELPADPVATDNYCLPTLSGEDVLTQMLNLRSGGVVYEDPFWFLLAAYNINKTASRFIIPRPANPQRAWQSRLEVLGALHNGQYQAEEWFAETLSPAVPNDKPAGLLQVSGADLIKLRTAGRGTLIDPDLGIGGYLLYGYEPDG
ncbi:MAG: hypothetical protein J7L25_10260 [Deltaproteobacteria bacterium]|nr:hypothetical protein [Candidatus Tharpella aukensis]